MLHSLHPTPTIVLKSQMAGHVTGVQDTRNKFEIWHTKTEGLREESTWGIYLLAKGLSNFREGL